MNKHTHLSWVNDQRNMNIFGTREISQCSDDVILGKKPIVPSTGKYWTHKQINKKGRQNINWRQKMSSFNNPTQHKKS